MTPLYMCMLQVVVVLVLGGGALLLARTWLCRRCLPAAKSAGKKVSWGFGLGFRLGFRLGLGLDGQSGFRVWV